MSVLIKGIEMPTNCWFCPVNAWDDDEYVCPFSGRTVKSGDVNRHDDCPLIPIPDHGDLIDKDALVDKAEFIGDAFSGRGGFAVWGEDVVNAPVVIPAERSEK